MSNLIRLYNPYISGDVRARTQTGGVWSEWEAIANGFNNEYKGITFPTASEIEIEVTYAQHTKVSALHLSKCTQLDSLTFNITGELDTVPITPIFAPTVSSISAYYKKRNFHVTFPEQTVTSLVINITGINNAPTNIRQFVITSEDWVSDEGYTYDSQISYDPVVDETQSLNTVYGDNRSTRNRYELPLQRITQANYVTLANFLGSVNGGYCLFSIEGQPEAQRSHFFAKVAMQGATPITYEHYSTALSIQEKYE